MEGEALFQVVLDDPLLLIGREGVLHFRFRISNISISVSFVPGYSFQILHAYYNLETILNEFQRRSANFEIAFWDSKPNASWVKH